jgi:23S rRNA pseudouridine2605 synthase
MTPSQDSKERIQKVLSRAGLASRRAVEELVLEGRLTVNGETVEKLPCFVGPGDEVRLDGRVVRKKPEPKTYILLNKPKGVICTQKNEPGRSRPKAVDLVPRIGQRVYCVGRLDADSTGLILLTNDGDLTERLTHPRYGVVKTYTVGVDGNVTGQELTALRRGMHLDGRRARALAVKLLHRGREASLLEVRLHEGRNRQVRRMLARLGHKVRRLHRRAIGPVSDRGIKIGNFRRLTDAEVAALRKQSGTEDAPARERPAKRAPRPEPKERAGGQEEKRAKGQKGKKARGPKRPKKPRKRPPRRGDR